MADITFSEIRTIIQRRIADASDATKVNQAINQAQREFAKRFFWPELRVRSFIQTYAAYKTGTITTDGTINVVLDSGVWPATVASQAWRLALAHNAPWYEIATRTDNENIELAEAYIGANVAGSAYIVYKTDYAMPSNCNRVESVWLHKDSESVELIDALTDEEVSDFRHYPSGPGTPTHFLPIERDGSGNKQYRIGPAIPDSVWRAEVFYRRETVDDTFEFPDRWPAIVARALAELYEEKFYDRHLRAMATYETLVASAILEERDVEQPSGRVGQDRVDLGPEMNRPLTGTWSVEDPS